MGITAAELEPRLLPVWVKLKNIPTDLYHANGISFVASGFGRPLHMDGRTAECKCLEFARVCIEIDAAKELLRNLTLVLPGDKECSVQAEYELTPPRCTQCKTFGHQFGECPRTKAALAEEQRKVVEMTHIERTEEGKADGKDKGKENLTEWQQCGRYNRSPTDKDGETDKGGRPSNVGQSNMYVLLGDAKEDGECSTPNLRVEIQIHKEKDQMASEEGIETSQEEVTVLEDDEEKLNTHSDGKFQFKTDKAEKRDMGNIVADDSDKGDNTVKTAKTNTETTHGRTTTVVRQSMRGKRGRGRGTIRKHSR